MWSPVGSWMFFYREKLSLEDQEGEGVAPGDISFLSTSVYIPLRGSEASTVPMIPLSW